MGKQEFQHSDNTTTEPKAIGNGTPALMEVVSTEEGNTEIAQGKEDKSDASSEDAVKVVKTEPSNLLGKKITSKHKKKASISFGTVETREILQESKVKCIPEFGGPWKQKYVQYNSVGYPGT